MRKFVLFGLMFAVVIAFVSFKTVQAGQESDVEWKRILKEAHQVQAEYASKQSTYSEIRSEFIKWFTKDSMMTVFVEHLIMDGDVFQFGTTDFSPYIIPKNIEGFSVIEKQKDRIVVKEDKQKSSELMGESKIQRIITISRTDEGWRISKLEWDQEV
ncbi:MULTISPECIES: DUF3993 domain-containing protein [Pontibacillus]|uniref:DUF3993 domain-containing protein n=1 Tax=Pontibacillus chungwhensis TaxID=265426 RepID=A0ABY8V206_9BACI|nr:MULTISPECIES: DUF3993 domain-containing protein [Pontibacillus]MCD5322499.1 DUF3993 domain-containing protein [Pontibacillus sp. HN14]WIF99784.1 DUF3993 domain-containing protein [Pontibacillus chungwhensis]